ncbi:hypothetical protein N665_0320s0093 [Sinapis alba]|nr:hypothetical protein N665_0320s0093 [Sinapis alba]
MTTIDQTAVTTGTKKACVIGGTGNLASKDMINPEVQGVINVLKSCLKSNSIKRVIYTSSAAAVSINNLSEPGLVMTEENWSDVDFLTKEKPFNWGYPISKLLEEKEAYKFAEENKIDLVTVVPALIAGNSLLSDPPSSLSLSMSLITGKEMHLSGLKEMQKLSGSISFIHVDDLARAHLFLAEKETASGRYICCYYNTNIPEIAEFLRRRYPKYNVLSEFEECLSRAKLTLSSEKLVKEGFRFEYGISEMYDEMVEYLGSKGLIKPKES